MTYEVNGKFFNEQAQEVSRPTSGSITGIPTSYTTAYGGKIAVPSLDYLTDPGKAGYIGNGVTKDLIVKLFQAAGVALPPETHNQSAFNDQIRAAGDAGRNVNYSDSPQSGQFYNRSGDIVDASGNPITDPNIRLQVAQSIGGDLNKLPIFASTNSGSSGGNTTGGTNPDLGPYADLYKQMQDYLTKLQQNGQVINPNVAITPDQLAAFTTQAASQIHPYYATQLAAATDSFLSGLGYNTDQFKNSVSQAQEQYGRTLDALGSTAADQGFAQSGVRQKQEGQLAGDVQNNLDQMRSSLFNTSENAARSFAQTYGGAQVPTAPTLGAAPRVLPGQSQFNTTGSNQGLYSLDSSIYNRLIGTQQNAEKQATDTLASQLSTNANQLKANTTQRSLL